MNASLQVSGASGCCMNVILSFTLSMQVSTLVWVGVVECYYEFFIWYAGLCLAASGKLFRPSLHFKPHSPVSSWGRTVGSISCANSSTHFFVSSDNIWKPSSGSCCYMSGHSASSSHVGFLWINFLSISVHSYHCCIYSC